MPVIADLNEQYDAMKTALSQLAKFIGDDNVCPDRTVIRSNFIDKDTTQTTPTDKYITVRVLSEIKTPSIFNNPPMHYWMDDNGYEYYVYQGIMAVEVRAYMGNALSDVFSIATKLRNRNLNYTYFQSTGTVGIAQIGSVTDSATITDDQSNETGATLIVNLSYLYKYTETDTNNSVDSIVFSTTTKDSSGSDEITTDDIEASL